MPGPFITQFLNELQESFAERIQTLKTEELCSLRAFDTGRWAPDYSDSLHRDFYLLKYSSAYMAEYYAAYRYILQSNWLAHNQVSALSLGCGAMLDLVGLEFARKNTPNFAQATPYYYGVDRVDWQNDNTRIITNVYSFYEGLENFALDSVKNKISILIFPKSISDISENSLYAFAHSLRREHLADRFCIISAMCKKDGEIDRTHNFRNILLQKLGVSVAHHREFKEESEKNVESILENPFVFNRNIPQDFKKLANNCQSCNCSFGQKNKCSSVIGRYPMRKVSNFNTTIYFMRNDHAVA